MTGWQPPSALMGLTTYLLSQTARSVKQNLDQQLALRGVRLPHMAVLADLASERRSITGEGTDPAAVTPGPSQLEVGRRLSIDPSDMTAVVDCLESLGYVARTVDPTDRRRRCLRLSAAGSRFLGELMEVAEAVANEMLAPLAADRRTAFLADLQVLGARAVQRRSEGDWT